MKINAHGTEISVILGEEEKEDYISLTDIAKRKNPENSSQVINNWMRSRSTIEFLGLWERLNNPNFKPLEFERFKYESGANAFTLSPKQWIDTTNAIGITSKSGRYGGTYAHSDIAFEFASWISPEFKLYIIKDYQRLKTEESHRKELGWDTKRELSKINYRIHTDAIKDILITPELTKAEHGLVYASEADTLNVALFGVTAKQWKAAHPEESKKKLNIRDFASVEELIVLVNLESMNADMIRQNIDISERVQKLRQVAYYQLKSLQNNRSVEKIKEKSTPRIEKK